MTSEGNGRSNAQNDKTIINTIYMKPDFPIIKKIGGKDGWEKRFYETNQSVFLRSSSFNLQELSTARPYILQHSSFQNYINSGINVRNCEHFLNKMINPLTTNVLLI